MWNSIRMELNISDEIFLGDQYYYDRLGFYDDRV